MVERIHAPVLAMEDLFPVMGEAGAETARSREEINKEWEAREPAKKTKRKWGTITPTIPPLSLFKAGQAEPLRSSCHVGRKHAAPTADDPANKQLP